ncbi:hypothetical protein Lfu02_35380 [Longispora fulva]|uniref:Uncharacterized protein n=1 Tax=Longispora fulva TaxID=619741 RepID=A0A8J7KNK0_9ACTN|nr:hypothetical protein [Longispora fulva]MBG6141679.1 hypothetical protein [Longispora fulva]GIG59166.1 hypothetical protein Lfu02_35380 [Longispora fulva]
MKKILSVIGASAALLVGSLAVASPAQASSSGGGCSADLNFNDYVIFNACAYGTAYDRQINAVVNWTVLSTDTRIYAEVDYMGSDGKPHFQSSCGVGNVLTSDQRGSTGTQWLVNCGDPGAWSLGYKVRAWATEAGKPSSSAYSPKIYVR